jgi:hypothetical protein
VTWRAHIDELGGWAHRRLPIYLVDQFPDGGYDRLENGGRERFRVVSEDTLRIEDPRPDPTLWLPEDAAPALLAALERHLGHATGGDQRLREDYLHERGRVDRMLQHLLDTEVALRGPS